MTGNRPVESMLMGTADFLEMKAWEFIKFYKDVVY